MQQSTLFTASYKYNTGSRYSSGCSVIYDISFKDLTKVVEAKVRRVFAVHLSELCRAESSSTSSESFGFWPRDASIARLRGLQWESEKKRKSRRKQ
jgi:hypothetical protein